MWLFTDFLFAKYFSKEYPKVQCADYCKPPRILLSICTEHIYSVHFFIMQIARKAHGTLGNHLYPFLVKDFLPLPLTKQ